MKKVFVLILIIFTCTIQLLQANIYHLEVTSSATGSAAGTFLHAYNLALGYISTGDEVFIEMNAPGLCLVDEAFPVCTLATNAKLTIRSGQLQFCTIPFQSPIQGFKMSNDLYINLLNNDFIHVFDFVSPINNNNTSVVFTNLQFLDFYPSAQLSFIPFIPNISCLTLQNIDDILITECKFDNTEHAIINNNSSIKIINNNFINTTGITTFTGTNLIQKACNIIIEGNEFNNSYNFFKNSINNSINPYILPVFDNTLNPENPIGGIVKIVNHYQVNNIQKVKVYNNSILDELGIGINVFNTYGLGNNLDLHIDIEFNTIETTNFNVWYNNPLRHFKLDNNILKMYNATFTDNLYFANFGGNIMFYSEIAEVEYLGFDLIAANDFGYQEFNGNNTFYGLSSIFNGRYIHSIFNVENFDKNITIINQNLPTDWSYGDSFRSVFCRGSSVKTSLGFSDNPFNVYQDANDLYYLTPHPFSISNLNIANGIFEATYSNPASTNTLLSSKKCFIDFYTSNSNGDLVSYIGTFSPNIGGGISPNIQIPNNINTNGVIRYAYATSTYDKAMYNAGNLHDVTHSGTSQVSYIESSDITHCCPNLQASITINGTTYNYDPNVISNPAAIIACAGEFMLNVNNCGSPNMEPYNWHIVAKDKMGDPIPDLELTSTNSNQIYTIASGVKTITISLTAPAPCSFNWVLTFNVSAPCELPCVDCISSFAPIPGKDYVLSAWVKENVSIENTINLVNYTNAKIVVEFEIHIPAQTPTTVTLPAFMASGQIIDTWQRIEREFRIPDYATDIKISLETANGKISYFDDIRVYPANGNMKSFVYDPESKRLVAELDERNYATFYEYNEEGKLTRIKKETEKGIFTIKESRSSLMKK